MTLLHLGNTVLYKDHLVKAVRHGMDIPVHVVITMQDRISISVADQSKSENLFLTFSGAEADAVWHTLTAMAVDVQQDYDIHLHETHLHEQEAQHDHPLFDRGTLIHPDILRNQGWQRALANFIRQGGIHTGYQYVQLNDAGGYSYHDEMPASADLDICVVLKIPPRREEGAAEDAWAKSQLWEQLDEQMHRGG